MKGSKKLDNLLEDNKKKLKKLFKYDKKRSVIIHEKKIEKKSKISLGSMFLIKRNQYCRANRWLLNNI